MTYTPPDDALRRAPLDMSNNSLFLAQIGNDKALFEEYEPGFEVDSASHGFGTSAREYRFMILGGRDINGVTVGAYCEATSGTQPVNLTTAPTDSGVFSVTGAAAWYTDTLALEGVLVWPGGTQELVVSIPAPGAGNLYVDAIRVALASSVPVDDIPYPSRYRPLDSSIAWGEDLPIPSEVVSRLRTNPSRLAIDRPVCVFAHASDTLRAITNKTPDLWGNANHALPDGRTAWSRVGRGTVPRCDVRDRWFRCYAYTTVVAPETQVASGSSGLPLPQATINVGSTTGFASAGRLVLWTNTTTRNVITYTGVTATTFTGCTGGTGTMTTGDRVGDDHEFSVRIGPVEERWTGPGWHSWRARLAPNEHQLWASVATGLGTNNAAAIRSLQVWRTEL